MPLFTAVKPSSSAHNAPQHKFIEPGMFTDTEYPIAAKIQQRRLQMLIHSRIYYELDMNVVSDHQWAAWATELKELQQHNSSIAERICFAEAFADWDASTGAFLPLNDPWVIRKTEQFLKQHEQEGNHVEYKEVQQSTGKPGGQSSKRKEDTKQRRNSLF